MRIFLYELKKIFNPVSIAGVAVLAFLVLFISRPFSELQFISRDCWQADAYKFYGISLSPEERKRAETEMPEYYYSKMNEYIALTPELAEIGIHNYDDAVFFEDVTVQLAYCVDDPDYTRILFDENKFTELYGVTPDDIRPLTEKEENARWTYFAMAEGETATLNLLMQKLEEFERDMRAYDAEKSIYIAESYFARLNDKKLLAGEDTQNINDAQWSREICRMIGYLAIIAVGCIFVLLAPLVTKENLCGIVYEQYTSKCGRRICKIRFAAMLAAAFAVMAVFTVICICGIKDYIPDELWNFRLNGFESFVYEHSARYWFGGTLLQYALLVGTLAYTLAAAVVAAIYFLSHTSGNYISLILKGIPAAAAACFISFVLLNGTLIYNAAGYELISVTRYIELPGINIFLIAILTAGSFVFFNRFYKRILVADVL